MIEYEYFKNEIAKIGYRIVEHPDQPWPNAVREIRDIMYPLLAAEAPELLGQSAPSPTETPCLPATERPRSIQLRIMNMKGDACQCACGAMNREVRLGYVGDCVYYAQWDAHCPDVPVQYAEVTFTGDGHFDFILAGVGEIQCSCEEFNHVGIWDGSKPYFFRGDCSACGPDGIITLTAAWDG